MLPTVSVLIANYNRSRYLGKAIASVLEQTYEDFELLIWDDGSKDNSLDIARSYAEKDSRVTVVPNIRVLQLAVKQRSLN